MTSAPPPSSDLSSASRRPRVLDIIGCHTDVTVYGHIALVRRLPLQKPEHRRVLDQYEREPADYEGRYSGAHATGPSATLMNYGHGFVALRLRGDVTRPELSEFLLAHGWKMIGFATTRDGDRDQISIIEKWCNIRDH